VEETQLSEEARPVVVEALAGEFVPVVEREHRAGVELDFTADPREPPPLPLVGPADSSLQNHVVVGDVALVNVDVQVRERPEQALVVGADAVAAVVVFVDRFVVVLRALPERRHDSVEVVSVLLLDVLFDDG
jgi:hypothetical protein